jgi:PKD repeat protein
MRFCIIFVSILFTLPARAQTPDSLDGASITIEKDGRSERYVLNLAPNPATQASTQPAIDPIIVSAPQGIAPFTVHVRAVGDNPSPDILIHRYEWDFGDEGSPYNRLVGWSAAHQYTRPGTYTITLRVLDPNGDLAGSTQTQVIVKPDQRRAIYVAADGDDKRFGTTPDQPIRSAGRAARLLAELEGHVKILFRRGDTFALDSHISIAGRDIVLDAYAPEGMGETPENRPVLRWARPSHGTMIEFAPEAWNVVIQDLAFEGPAGIEALVIRPTGRNLTVRGCSFRNVSSAINAEKGLAGLLAQDCEVLGETGMSGYFIWCVGSDYVVLGNKVPNSTRQHCLRVGTLNRLLLAHNDFTNLDRRKAEVNPDPDDTAKGCATLQKGSFFYVTDNHFRFGGVGVGPLGGKDGARDPGARTTFAVIESNHLSEGPIVVNPGSVHVVIRNNFIRRHGWLGLDVRGTDPAKNDAGVPYFDRPIEDISIVHNTVVNTDSGTAFAGFFHMTDKVPQGTITLKNNLFVAPRLEVGWGQRGVLYIEAPDLRHFASISGNCWTMPLRNSWVPGAWMYVWPAWSDKKGYLTPQQWFAFPQVQGDVFETVTLDDAGAPPADSGATRCASFVPGAWRDLTGRPRDRERPTAGAVEVAR